MASLFSVTPADHLFSGLDISQFLIAFGIAKQSDDFRDESQGPLSTRDFRAQCPVAAYRYSVDA
jgi:hypothetical protein